MTGVSYSTHFKETVHELKTEKGLKMKSLILKGKACIKNI